MNKNTIEQGCVSLIWLVIAFILDLIFLITYLVWKSKIALFLLGIGTVLLVLTIIIFALFIYYTKQDIKRFRKE